MTMRGIMWRYRVLVALFALALATRVTYTLDAVRDMRHQYPMRPVVLGAPWPSIEWVDDNARAAGLQVGDRVVAIDGQTQKGLSDLFVALRHKNPGDTMAFSIDRHGQRLTIGTKIRPAAFGAGALAIVFRSVLLILLPWLC